MRRTRFGVDRAGRGAARAAWRCSVSPPRAVATTRPRPRRRRRRRDHRGGAAGDHGGGTARDDGGGAARHRPRSPAAPAITVMGVVAPEKANDYGWNQQGVEGAQAAADSIGAEMLVADGAGYDDVTPILRQLAEDGVPVHHRAGQRLQHGRARVRGRDGDPGHHLRQAGHTTPGLVADVSTSSQQGAYLAGVLAAKMYQTGTVGIVDSGGRHELEQAVRRLRRQGAQRQPGHQDHPDADRPGRLRRRRRRQARDRERHRRRRRHRLRPGRRLALRHAPGGRDRHAARGRGQGLVHRRDRRQGARSTRAYLLSSVLWDFTPVYRAAIADIAADTFGTKGYDLNVSTTSVSLLQTDNIPADVWAEIDGGPPTDHRGGSIEITLTPASTT